MKHLTLTVTCAKPKLSFEDILDPVCQPTPERMEALNHIHSHIQTIPGAKFRAYDEDIADARYTYMNVTKHDILKMQEVGIETSPRGRGRYFVLVDGNIVGEYDLTRNVLHTTLGL